MEGYQYGFDFDAKMPIQGQHTCKFDSTRTYRWFLEAKLSTQEGACLFIMLNPSTADEQQSDPTVTRCKDWTKKWGYGTLWVCNIFGFRSTDPGQLKLVDDPIGRLNDHYILKYAKQADRIICAWGTHGELLDRGPRVLHMLEEESWLGKTYHLGELTKDGHPGHPLYKKGDVELMQFEPNLEGAW